MPRPPWPPPSSHGFNLAGWMARDEITVAPAIRFHAKKSELSVDPGVDHGVDPMLGDHEGGSACCRRWLGRRDQCMRDEADRSARDIGDLVPLEHRPCPWHHCRRLDGDTGRGNDQSDIAEIYARRLRSEEQTYELQSLMR